MNVSEFFLPNPRSDIKSILKNGRALKKSSSKNIHITGDAHYLLYFLKKNSSIITVHDIMYLSYLSGLKRVVWKILYVVSLKRAKKIIFISDFAKNQVLKEVFLPGEKFTIIPNPIPPEFAHHPKNFDKKNPTILHINGHLERKNLGRTIEAIQNLKCRLRIIGKLSSANINLLNKYNISYSVAQNLTNEEVINEYINCDIVNFPSLLEGFGMPIIEGQAIGRPVVTSNIPPMKDVAGEGGLTVDPKSVLEIREAYKNLIENDEFRNKVVTDGLINVERFKLGRIAQQYQSVYNECFIS